MAHAAHTRKYGTSQAVTVLVLAAAVTMALTACGDNSGSGAAATGARLLGATTTGAGAGSGTAAASPAGSHAADTAVQGVEALTAAELAAPASIAGAAAGVHSDHAAPATSGSIDRYSVINLAPLPVAGAAINGRAQAAFDYYDGTRLVAGFFNGLTTVPVSLPTASRTFVSGLNYNGMVAGITLQDEAMPQFLAYRWTAPGGLVTLPPLASDSGAYVGAINRRGDIVGGGRLPSLPGEPIRAVRWQPDNVLVPLPAPGFGESSAGDINDASNSAGYAVAADGHPHAFVWNGLNRPFDLGTMGGSWAVASRINNLGDVAGQVNTDLPGGGSEFQGFLWSKRHGRVVFGASGVATVIHALNESGAVAGRVVVNLGESTHAFYFSRSRGLVNLHAPAYDSSIANDLNGTTVVGWMGDMSEGVSMRAYRWTHAALPVDLNSRLSNAPAGLELYEALAISAGGDILANSNAGLVMLRPCGCGTDAPVLGPVTGEQPRLDVAWPISLAFRDRNLSNTHTATIDWGDGSPVEALPVTETAGQGSVSGNHTYTANGNYMVVVRITDSTGKTTQVHRDIQIFELGGPDLRGSGVLTGATIEPQATGRGPRAALSFAVAAPLAEANGVGKASFRLRGALHFNTERVDQLTRQGGTVRLEGSGRLNGQAGYRFTLEATDGNRASASAPDRLALRITRTDPRTGVQHTALDYGMAAPASRTASAGTAAARARLPAGTASLGQLPRSAIQLNE